MKAKEVSEIFRLMYDRYASQEGVTDYEMSRFINDAALLTMKYHFQPHKGKYQNSINKDPVIGFENTSYDAEDFQPVIYDSLTATSNVSGLVLNTAFTGSFPNVKVYQEDGGVIEDERAGIFHYVDVLRYNGSDFFGATWMRHNELKTAQDNSFTKPSSETPAYVYIKDGIRMVPTGARNVKVTVVRYPTMFWWLPEQNIAVDPEFKRSLMMDIIQRAVKLAAVSVRDGDGYKFLTTEQQES